MKHWLGRTLNAKHFQILWSFQILNIFTVSYLPKEGNSTLPSSLLFSHHPIRWKILNYINFRGNPSTLTMLLSLDLAQLHSVSWRVMSKCMIHPEGRTVCLFLLYLQCKDGSCLWFCSSKLHEEAQHFMGLLTWSAFSAIVFRLSVIAWSPQSCGLDNFPRNMLPYIYSHWMTLICWYPTLMLTYPDSQESSWMPSLSIFLPTRAYYPVRRWRFPYLEPL